MVNNREGRKQVEIDGEVLHETEKAYLFDSGHGPDAVWLPKSMVEWNPDEKKMTLPQWFAEKKEIV